MPWATRLCTKCGKLFITFASFLKCKECREVNDNA